MYIRCCYHPLSIIYMKFESDKNGTLLNSLARYKIIFLCYLQVSNGFVNDISLCHIQQCAEKSKLCTLLLFPCKNRLNLQPPVECLVEKKSGLKGWYDGKPSQDSNGGKQDYAHPLVIGLSKHLSELPDLRFVNQRPADLCNL